MKLAHTNIDDYLAGVSPAQRRVLSAVRQTIHAALPEVEECISYRIPAFRSHGEVVAGFSARGEGCSYYPFSGRTLQTLKKDVAGRSQTKSALHFDCEKGLSPTLVRKLLRARIAEIGAR